MRVSSRIIELLNDVPSLRAATKAVYVAALMRQPQSLSALATMAGLKHESVVKHCRALEHAGWMRLVTAGRRLRPEATIPHEVETTLAAQLSKIVALSPFKGEETATILLEWVLAPTVELIYHARPDFLRNPETGQNLEYDVFAPDYSWALEYQGDQHFGPTPLYQGDRQFVDRHRRDLIKARLSKQNGVRLSFITKDDLKLEGILQAIPADIPRRPFNPTGPVVQALEKLGEEIAGRQDADRE